MSSTALAYTAVTVPAITDPDIAEVDVVIAQPPIVPGDAVIAIPLEAMEANCLVLSAYVTVAGTVRCVFGSRGGNVAGGAKQFAFYILRAERSGW